MKPEAEPDMQERERKLWFVAYTAVLSAGLLALALGGAYSRYLADDFCTAGTLRQMGFAASQAYWYESWSGRYAFTLLISLAHSVGPALTPFLPGLILSLWLGALIYLAAQAMGLEQTRRSTWLASGLGAGVLVATFVAAPNLYQSLYWQTGLLTYAVPLVILTAYAGWVIWMLGKPRLPYPIWAGALVSAMVLFVAGGFSETTAVLQVIVIGSAWLGSLLLVLAPAKGRVVAVLSAGMVGSIAALMVVALAPGNQVRLGLMPDPPALSDLLAVSAGHVRVFGARLVRREFLSLLVPFLLGFAALFPGLHPTAGQARRLHLNPRSWLAAGWIVITCLVACFAMMALAAYAQSSYPDGRVLLPAIYLMAAGSGAVGALIASEFGRFIPSRGRALRWLVPAGRLVVLLAVISLGRMAIGDARAYAPDSRQFAQAWDRREAAVQAAASLGERELAVASLTHMGGLAEISRDESEWINRCFADAYDLKKVWAK